VSSIIAIGFIILTIIFEKCSEGSFEWAAKLSDVSTKIHEKIHRESSPLSQNAMVTRAFLKLNKGMHPKGKAHIHLMASLLRMETGKELNYVSQVVGRLHAELSVLGFLAFLVYITTRVGAVERFCDRWGGENGNHWLPQRANELSELIEAVHFSLFLGMCLYFAVMAVVGHFGMLKFIPRMFHYEELLEEERSSGAPTTGLSPRLARGLAWYRKLRERFVARVSKRPGGECVDDEFQMAAYLKVNLDLLFRDLIEPSLAAWSFLISLLVGKLLCARLYDYADDMPNVDYLFAWFGCILVLIWAVFVAIGHEFLEHGEVGRIKRLTDWGMNHTHEAWAIHSIQGFLPVLNPNRFKIPST
jgi:hypothetical protein